MDAVHSFPPRARTFRLSSVLSGPEPSTLEYRVHQKEDAAAVELRGVLADEEWTDRLLSFLEENFLGADCANCSVIQMDLSGVRVIDLEGVATLIRLATVARDRGKRLIVHGASGSVREKLAGTGVLDILSQPA